MKNQRPDIKAKGKPEWTTLYDHLDHVRVACVAFASHLKMDTKLASLGAVLHDIGKANPIFQRRLVETERPTTTFRHEIASLFFLPIIPVEQWPAITEMIIGHHKSVKDDVRSKGLLDLLEEEDEYGDTINYHLANWEEWSPDALDILSAFGLSVKPITRNEAIAALEYVATFSKAKTNEIGFSTWRGLLVGADHFASAMINDTWSWKSKLFQIPDLRFFNRESIDYPLSMKLADSPRPHTIVVASTGAGKTDYLFRRCTGRVFYFLPFQASINAMYFRLMDELKEANPDLDLRLLHGASSIVAPESNPDEQSSKDEKLDVVVQSLFGSGIKVLTPFQVAAIMLGRKGYESILLDMKDCDIILDEIHTYSEFAQGMVLKIVEILTHVGCRVHVGTATMPTSLFNEIVRLLGVDDTHVERLTEEEIAKYDRHTIIKGTVFDEALSAVDLAIANGEKVLLIANRIASAQERYVQMKERYPGVPVMLLHSRFKRGDRFRLEKLLIGKDDEGNPTGTFNTSQEACIVVSTQVVEVSIDISFDLMVTDCAPLDSLIQRFGRINRKRNKETIGLLKPIIVLAPPDEGDEKANEKLAKPYNYATLQRSFTVLPNGKLRERDLQNLLDQVYPDLAPMSVDTHSILINGEWDIKKMLNRKRGLVELLKIDSVSCILDTDIQDYKNGNKETRMNLEMSVPYFYVQECLQLEWGSWPRCIPTAAYDTEMGLEVKQITNKLSTGEIL